MIYVYSNQPQLQYDIYSLVKAFFPEEELEIHDWPPNQGQASNPIKTGNGNGNPADPQFGETTENQFKESDKHQYRDSVAPQFGETTENQFRESDKRQYRDSAAPQFGKQDGYRAGNEAITEGSSSTETKNILKRNIYELLKQGTGKELPWGTLTGIRPTKIPMKQMEEGRTKREIARYMKKTYRTSDDKIRLCMEIAERELALLENIDFEDGYSIYIGIPFCPSTCLYCSFPSFPLASWNGKTDAYLDALEKELEFTAAKCARRKLNSVYIGGGTPTSLTSEQLERLVHTIQSLFDLKYCQEFTVEAGRPDSITEGKLQVLRRYPVSRISINPQTMKQETLDLIGRRHTVEQIRTSFWMARELGFDNINMDLILGLPRETIDDVRHTMEEIQKLMPDSVTVHSLAIKRAARLNMQKELYRDNICNTNEHMSLCSDYCHAMGMAPYYLYRQKSMAGNLENVGYAKEGKAGIYNILIMEEKQTIMALGAGAITKKVYPDGRIERCENVKDVTAYMTRIDEMIERKRNFFADCIW